MKSREELQREFAGNPVGLLEYIGQLQEQLNQKEQLLAATHQELAQRQQELARQEQLLAEARAYIAELKRQLFGPKADKLTPEQEEQLRQLTGDLREQAQRPAPLSQDVLEPEWPAKDKEKLRREARRRRQGIGSLLGAQCRGVGTLGKFFRQGIGPALGLAIGAETFEFALAGHMPCHAVALIALGLPVDGDGLAFVPDSLWEFHFGLIFGRFLCQNCVRSASLSLFRGKNGALSRT